MIYVLRLMVFLVFWFFASLNITKPTSTTSRFRVTGLGLGLESYELGLGLES